MSETQARETLAPPRANAWLEVREGAIAWLAADRPEWFAGNDEGDDGRVVLQRVIDASGIDKNVIRRAREQEGKHGPASIDGNNLARLVALAADERGVADEIAFANLFRIVRMRDLAEVAA